MVFLNGKSIYYELRYLAHRFPLHRFLLLFFTLLGALIVSLSDAQAFFTNNNSPIPKSWTVVKDPNNARLIAIGVIVFPGIFIWLSQGYSNSKEMEELLQIVQAFSLPFLERDLNNLHGSFTSQFGLSKSCRIYILQPIRKSLLNWHLHIICYSGNMEKRELSIRLDLDEGPIGSAFQSIKRESKYQGKRISNPIDTTVLGFIQNAKKFKSTTLGRRVGLTFWLLCGGNL